MQTKTSSLRPMPAQDAWDIMGKDRVLSLTQCASYLRTPPQQIQPHVQKFTTVPFTCAQLKTYRQHCM